MPLFIRSKAMVYLGRLATSGIIGVCFLTISMTSGAAAQSALLYQLSNGFLSLDEFSRQTRAQGKDPESILSDGLKESTDYKVRGFLIEQLGKLHAKAAVGEIRASVEKAQGQEKEFLEYYAAQAMGRIGNADAIRLLLDIWRTTKSEDIAFKGQLLPDILDSIQNRDASIAFIEELRRTNGLKIQSTQKLGRLHEKQATTEIARFLDDPLIDVRATAAWALYLIGDPRARESLRASMKREKDEGLRIVLAAGLSRLGEQDGVEVLNSAIHEEGMPWERRTHAIELATKARLLHEVDLLEELTTDRDSLIRAKAVELLGKYGCHSSVPILRRIGGEDEWDDLRRSAMELAEAIAKREDCWFSE